MDDKFKQEINDRVSHLEKLLCNVYKSPEYQAEMSEVKDEIDMTIVKRVSNGNSNTYLVVSDWIAKGLQRESQKYIDMIKSLNPTYKTSVRLAEETLKRKVDSELIYMSHFGSLKVIPLDTPDRVIIVG